jgi:hypothetical protein
MSLDVNSEDAIRKQLDTSILAADIDESLTKLRKGEIELLRETEEEVSVFTQSDVDCT